MSPRKTLNIGLVGCGFMGRAHSSAFFNRLQYFDHRDEDQVRGRRSLHVTDSGHPLYEALVGSGPADRLRA
jgi:hypothetical protein